jgi:photosystem II stability/assembly factor-like uncharacterized protein
MALSISSQCIRAQQLHWKSVNEIFRAAEIRGGGEALALLGADSNDNSYAYFGPEGIIRTADSLAIHWDKASYQSLNPNFPTPYACAPKDTCYLFGGAHNLVSYDRGGTWNTMQTPKGFSAYISSIVAPSGVYVATGSGLFFQQGGLFRSSDGGKSWSHLNSPTVSDSVVSRFAISHSGSIYESTRNQAALYRSDDLGMSWTEVDSGLAKSNISSIAFDHLDNIYIAISRGIYKSVDKGAHWTRIENYFHTPEPSRIGQIAINSDGVIFVQEHNHFIRSRDGGTTWTLLHPVADTNRQLGAFLLTNHNLLVTLIDTDLVISRNDGGVWQLANSGDFPASVYSISMTPDENLFASIADHPCISSSDFGTTWIDRGADFLDKTVNGVATAGNSVFLSTTDTLFRSLDVGATWSATSLSKCDTGKFSMLVARDGKIFAGLRRGLSVSSDNGMHWASFAPAIVRGAVHGLTIDSSSDMFVAVDSFLYRTKDGANWSESAVGAVRTTIAALVTTANGRILVASENGVFGSSDRGESWSLVDSIPTKCLAIYDSSTVLSSGPDAFGTRMSNNNGQSWIPADTSLGSAISCFASNARGKFFAGTLWTGIYSATISKNGVAPGRNQSLFYLSANPFASKTSLICSVPRETKLHFEIFDLLGRALLSAVSNTVYRAGKMVIPIDLTGQPTGSYYVRVSLSTGTTQTIVLLKQ